MESVYIKADFLPVSSQFASFCQLIVVWMCISFIRQNGFKCMELLHQSSR